MNDSFITKIVSIGYMCIITGTIYVAVVQQGKKNQYFKNMFN